VVVSEEKARDHSPLVIRNMFQSAALAIRLARLDLVDRRRRLHIRRLSVLYDIHLSILLSIRPSVLYDIHPSILLSIRSQRPPEQEPQTVVDE